MADNKEIIDIGVEDKERKDQEITRGEDHGLGTEEGPTNTSRKERHLYPFRWKFWSLIVFFLVFIVLSGVLFTLEKLPIFTRKDTFSEINIVPSNLSEEILSPFYIQALSGSESFIRIDLSIVWDGLALVRYTKLKLRIRNDLYEYFNNMVTQEQKNFKNMSSDLEAGIHDIICESLNVNGIVVKIKEISCF